MINFFKHYIDQNYHLSNAIKSFQTEQKDFTLKKFNELLKKNPKFKETFEECKQMERDEVKDALKKLACGIPIKDTKNEIIGWQEKPDIKAIEEIHFSLK
ncbi:hypothetical protein P3875_04240 [Myroides sp. JBRI-B21084]|uniref:hypothetical protein n=1 Tax=Myroides sp. JBRI-B21084 TaxID=3119977 RepID=UPI0026E31D3A|nr:hypothetical protein [Paenimyroides cloacae]WKW47282.1 hypothetical protein P3875_04240 [Paenimyroides cloacae]